MTTFLVLVLKAAGLATLAMAVGAILANTVNGHAARRLMELTIYVGAATAVLGVMALMTVAR